MRRATSASAGCRLRGRTYRHRRGSVAETANPPRRDRPARPAASRRAGAPVVRALPGTARPAGSRCCSGGSFRWPSPSLAGFTAPASRWTTSCKSPASGFSTRSIASTSTEEPLSSSYAVPTILGELRRHFRDRTWSVHVPRDLQEQALKVERATVELSAAKGRTPSIGEVAEALGLTDEEVLEARRALVAYEPLSLDAPAVDDNDRVIADALGDDQSGYSRAERLALLDGLTVDQAPARGAGPAIPRGPHAAGDRRAGRAVADAGLAAPAAGDPPPRRRRRRLLSGEAATRGEQSAPRSPRAPRWQAGDRQTAIWASPRCGRRPRHRRSPRA